MASWHEDPNLQSHFPPNFPDDLQVIVHDGGPRLAKVQPELMWVRVIAQSSALGGAIYEGIVANVPHGLRSVRHGDAILFLAPPGVQYPFRVMQKYLNERPGWIIHPCNKCGLPELFDAPSDLIRVIFPNVQEGDQLVSFTSFCPLCSGVQVIESKHYPQ